MYTTNLQHDRMTWWDNTPTLDWKIPSSNPTDELSQALGPNLITRLPVTFGSNKITQSDYLPPGEWGCLPVTVAQSCPWITEIAEKNSRAC